MGTFATSWTAGDPIPASELNTISGAFSTWTPTIGGTGWALGNGTVAGRYKKVGRVIVAGFSITWGGTSTFGGSALTVSAPATAVTGMAATGSGIAVDTGTSGYDLTTFIASAGTVINLYAKSAAGTYVTSGVTGLTTSVPHTWASTDVIYGSIVYEAAS